VPPPSGGGADSNEPTTRHDDIVNMTKNIGYSLWLEMVRGIPMWEFTLGAVVVGGAIVFFLLYCVLRRYQVNIFHAFEKKKIKQKDVDNASRDTAYIEITIPKNSQATAFQVQQKILRARR